MDVANYDNAGAVIEDTEPGMRKADVKIWGTL